MMAGLITGSAMLTGCASIVNGTDENFSLESNPAHAFVRVDGNNVGKTPVQISLARKSDHDIRVQVPGYQTENIHLTKSMSGWMLGNIVFGGFIGIAVDAVDGAMYKLTPKQMSEYATNNSMNYDSSSHKITVLMTKNANKNWKKIGQLKSA